MKDIADDNLFFINVNSLNLNHVTEKYNTKRQPEKCVTIDSLIAGLRNGNVESAAIKNINFVKPLPKPNGLNYSKEFKKDLEQIKKNQILKDVYNKPLDSEESQQSIQEMHKEIKEQLTTIVNILLTVVSCIVACWYWTPYLKIHYRLFLCIFVGILVLVADVVVYNSFQRNIKNSKKNEPKKEE